MRQGTAGKNPPGSEQISNNDLGGKISNLIELISEPIYCPGNVGNSRGTNQQLVEFNNWVCTNHCNSRVTMSIPKNVTAREPHQRLHTVLVEVSGM